ncbi:MAG: hypothetical protein K9M84_02650 [Spirochaetia bacterium]|nr:hypothetical protein [Spirochaetia bacterium]MCF7940485.1 hypothetical protein [Spirochaetia bacterium]
MSVTDTLACDLPESDITSNQAEFNQQNDLQKTADTTSGFTIYYEYTTGTAEPVDPEPNRYMRKTAVLPEGQSVYVTSAPNLETEQVTGSQIEEDLFGTLTYSDTDDSLSVQIYTENSHQEDKLVIINGSAKNYLYKSTDSYDDSLLNAEEDKNYLHLYIEYFVFDENYNPIDEFSSLKHLGYIKLEE